MGGFFWRGVSVGPQATRRLGRRLGRLLPAASILALSGDLGSGKTVFVRGLAEGLGIPNPDDVRSPTFALVQEHPGRPGLCHADLYRLERNEAADLGLEDYWRTDAARDQTWVVAVEWAEKAGGLIPGRALSVVFRHLAPERRELTLSGGKEWKRILGKWPKRKGKNSWS